MEKITNCDEEMDRRIAELESELDTLRRSMPSVTLSGLLKFFYESNLIPVWRSNIRGDILDCNQAYADLLGYSREELLSGEIGWLELTPPEYKQAGTTVVEQILKTGCATPFEKEYLRKDGSRVRVIVSCTATDLTGEDILVICFDITELRQSELQVQRSEEQFRTIVDLIPQIVYISGPDGLDVDYVNKRYLDFTGHEPQAVLDSNWRQLVHPDDLPVVIGALKRAIKKGVLEMEIRHRHKNGEYHWSLVRSLPIRQADGTILKWIGTVTDIDEQKRVELELREREESFRLLAHAIPQIVWTATACGEIEFFNDRWLEVTGLSVEQSLSGGWKLLVHPNDIDEYLEKWTNAIKSGETYEHEFRLKRAVGLARDANGYRWQLCRAVAMRNQGGEVIKWFGTWTEIHEQKASH